MSTTLDVPPMKIINVRNETKDSPQDADFAIDDALGLEGVISARYVQISEGNQHTYTTEEGENLICYIITGNGQLRKGDRIAALASGDCFSFAASNAADTFTLEAAQATDTMMSMLMISDVWSGQKIPSVASPGFPTIISGDKAATWRNKGIDSTKAVRLVKDTDMGQREDPPWGLNLERIPPGTQSSNAHAHMLEDEFVFILGGKARYWHQGESPERTLHVGDAVGWKAGTGVCHTLLNDAEDENGAGEDLVFLVWGRDLAEDKVHYATSNPPWWTNEYRWWDCPALPVGPASSLPRHPRPKDKSYPS